MSLLARHTFQCNNLEVQKVTLTHGQTPVKEQKRVKSIRKSRK